MITSPGVKVRAVTAGGTDTQRPRVRGPLGEATFLREDLGCSWRNPWGAASRSTPRPRDRDRLVSRSLLRSTLGTPDMTKAKGRARIERGIADMSESTEVVSYEPPLLEECRVRDQPIDLGADVRLHDHTREHQGLIVYFSLQLSVIRAADWFVVARIDTCHGEVHKHQFYRDGRDETRTLVRTVPVDNGAATVDSHYLQGYDMLVEEHADIIRRWES